MLKLFNKRGTIDTCDLYILRMSRHTDHLLLCIFGFLYVSFLESHQAQTRDPVVLIDRPNQRLDRSSGHHGESPMNFFQRNLITFRFSVGK
jgi:hypothetical protein